MGPTDFDPALLALSVTLSGSAPESAKVTSLKKAYTDLWEQIAVVLAEGDGCERVYVSADGDLCMTPFALLLDPNQGREFLGLKLQIVQVPSGRYLVRQGNNSLAKKKAYFVVDPAFSLSDAAESSSKPASDSNAFELEPLPETEDAAEKITKILADHGWLNEVFNSDRATKSGLLSINDSSILHIATHGVGLNSLNVLAFAGAKKSLLKTEEGPRLTSTDGLLFPAEFKYLSLANTWLLVLCACNTATGDVRWDEGTDGLRRSCIEAGPQNFIYTLWTIGADESQLFLEDFYSRLMQGGDPADAYVSVIQQRLRAHAVRDAIKLVGPFQFVTLVRPGDKPYYLTKP